jgi:predicted ester cyclase
MIDSRPTGPDDAPGAEEVETVNPVALVEAYIAALNSRDPDRIAALVADAFVNEHTSRHRQSLEGRSAYRERLPIFLAGFPKLEYEVEDVVHEGAKVVVAYRLRADRIGEQGEAPMPIDVRGVFRFRVVDGEIAHRVDYFDGVTIEEQIGRRP